MDQTSAMIPAHPDEMQARVEISLGGGRTLAGTARATPAGLITAAMLASADLLSAAALIRATTARPQAERGSPAR